MSDDFDAFVVGRGRALLRFAYLLCGNGHQAEDIVQEVLARVHPKWRRIERMAAPDAYVRKAIVREYLSWRRRRASTELAVAQVPDRPDPHDPERAFADRGEMWQLLAQLPRAQRAVLVLRFYDDLSDDEIAETLGCGRSTVRAHASRALAQLRTLLSHARPGHRWPGERQDQRRTVEVDGG
jgi:RNA polymerase sigma-70 factor (sigma-E family)